MFGASGVKPTLALEASSTMALIGLVKAGLGVTIYPGRLSQILGPALAVRPLAGKRFRIATILVWKRTNRTESLRSFVAIARDIARAASPNPG